MINPDIPDLVAVWKIPLPHGLQVIEFEHGETSGKRVVRVNGQEVRFARSCFSVSIVLIISIIQQILRREWMFNLIGSETLRVGGGKVVKISIGSEGLMFKYAIEVDGKNLESFVKDMNKQTRTWFPIIDKKTHRIVIGNTITNYSDIIILVCLSSSITMMFP